MPPLHLVGDDITNCLSRAIVSVHLLPDPLVGADVGHVGCGQSPLKSLARPLLLLPSARGRRLAIVCPCAMPKVFFEVVVTHQLSVTSPAVREFLEPAFHLGIGVYDEERPWTLPFPVIGVGAARKSIHPLSDLLAVLSSHVIVMVDDGCAALGKLLLLRRAGSALRSPFSLA